MKAYHGKKRARRIVGDPLATAGEMIGRIEPGCEIFGLTAGQFSFVDILEHVLNEIGPAHCIVSTWTASYANIEKAMRFCSDSRLISCRWLVDRSFKTRKPELCKHLVDVFGKDAIRTASSHAKFMLLWSEKWNIVIRTSMNLNENPRIEDFEISDDPLLMAYMRELCENVFCDDLETEGFSTKNETQKVAKHMKTGDLWENQISLNTARLKLNV
jgi:hypothetical protein